MVVEEEERIESRLEECKLGEDIMRDVEKRKEEEEGRE